MKHRLDPSRLDGERSEKTKKSRGYTGEHATAAARSSSVIDPFEPLLVSTLIHFLLKGKYLPYERDESKRCVATSRKRLVRFPEARRNNTKSTAKLTTKYAPTKKAMDSRPENRTNIM
jgi:hypothetical protein